MLSRGQSRGRGFLLTGPCDCGRGQEPAMGEGFWFVADGIANDMAIAQGGRKIGGLTSK